MHALKAVYLKVHCEILKLRLCFFQWRTQKYFMGVHSAGFGGHFDQSKICVVDKSSAKVVRDVFWMQTKTQIPTKT